MSTASVADKKPCVACGDDIPSRAKICSKCKSPQIDMKACPACREPIRPGAKVCNVCKTNQTIPRQFGTVATWIGYATGWVGILSIAFSAARYVGAYDSHTQFKVISSDPQHVFIRVWNTGQPPSILVGYRLIADESPDKEMALEPSAEDTKTGANVITSARSVLLGLSPVLPADVPLARPQYTPAERAQIVNDGKRPLNGLPMTLEMDVQESNDPRGTPWSSLLPKSFISKKYVRRVLAPREAHIRRDHFTANRIAAFIKENFQ